MGEEIAFENGWISDFQELVTLTLDRVILHTGMHQSSTSTYVPNFIEFEETFCGRMYGRTFETHFINDANDRPLQKIHALNLTTINISSSATTERSRNALSQLKSELLHSCTKNHIWQGLQQVSDLEGHSRSRNCRYSLDHISLSISGL